MFNPHAAILENPVRVLLQSSPLLVILLVVVAVLGIIAQIKANRAFTLEEYDRWSAAAS